MKRIWGSILSLAAVGTAVGAAMPACATNDQSIFIRAALAPPTSRQGGACVYTNDPQQAQLFQLALDVGLNDSYFAVLLVGNQMISRTQREPNGTRAESNRTHINGGVVRVTEPNGDPIHSFTSLGTGFNDTGTNNAPGYGAVGLVVLDAESVRRIVNSANPPLSRSVSKTVLINVKVFGTSLGDTDVESGEYQVPMQICNGCLVDFSKGYDPTKAPGNCDKPDEESAGSADGPCRLGQDLAVDCRKCRGLPACGSL